MAKYLVTGGAGFIGSHGCEALLRQGDSVICLDNFNDFYDPRLKRRNLQEVLDSGPGEWRDRFVLADGDVLDEIWLHSIFARYQPDGVIHLAACAGVRQSLEQPQQYLRVNVLGTANVLECMREFGVRGLAFGSSSSVYGRRMREAFCETDSTDEPVSPYAASKKAGEALCHCYSRLYEFRIACLRFFSVYGPRQRPDLAMTKFARAMLDDLEIPFFGNGDSSRDYTYIDDIIQGVLGALDWAVCDGGGDCQAFNIGTGRGVSLIQMLKSLEKALAKTGRMRRLPEQSCDMPHTWADTGKARRTLGYAPKVEFDEGVRRFVTWLRESEPAE